MAFKASDFQREDTKAQRREESVCCSPIVLGGDSGENTAVIIRIRIVLATRGGIRMLAKELQE